MNVTMIIYISTNIKIYVLKHAQKYQNFYMEIQLLKFIIIIIKQNA